MADASPADTPVAMEASEVPEAFEATDSPALETVAEEPTQPKKRGRPPGSKDKNPGARPSRRLNPPSPVEEAPQEEPHPKGQVEPSQQAPQEEPHPKGHPKGLPAVEPPQRKQRQPRTPRTQPTQPTQPTPSTPPMQPTPTPEIGVHEAWRTLSRHLGFEDPKATQAAKAQWAANLLSNNFH